MHPMKMIAMLMFALILIPAVSILTGTVLWLLWPVMMVNVWHLPPMTWWQCVAGLWTLSLIASAFTIKAEVK